ncbi:hypothetical protein IQ267_07920 [filamentous cyanobacterium LEGE 07170]|nr:hypothetical protein [filamentous cyanobacterium LEGE 07170]
MRFNLEQDGLLGIDPTLGLSERRSSPSLSEISVRFHLLDALQEDIVLGY